MNKVKAFCIYFVAALIVMMMGEMTFSLDISHQYKMITVSLMCCLMACFLYVVSQDAQRGLGGQGDCDEWN
ncbi:TPA: hypothetical protein RQL24_003393 [Vibrio vulnificus]|nr:hypothetical protein [Vibrio vulnificus]HDY8080494.1 hypothetical protein [Vibrio vulnificus]HDY8191284.1 hypothetical protein [Vibrio vulnificus]